MDLIVHNKQGENLGSINQEEVYSIREDQTDPFYTGRRFTITIHYSSRLWSILRSAHTAFEINKPEYKVEISKIDMDRENPFIIVTVYLSEVI